MAAALAETIRAASAILGVRVLRDQQIQVVMVPTVALRVPLAAVEVQTLEALRRRPQHRPVALAQLLLRAMLGVPEDSRWALPMAPMVALELAEAAVMDQARRVAMVAMEETITTMAVGAPVV